MLDGFVKPLHAWTDNAVSLDENLVMAIHGDGHSKDGFAMRLKALRLAFGPELGRTSQAAFSDYVGIGPTAWNNYEKLGVRPDLDAARKLAAKFSVTLDWIYEGNPAGLSLGLIEKLRPHLEPVRRRA